MLGRTPTVEEPPADIDVAGNEVIVKYEHPAGIILALTPVNAEVPVFLIVTDCAVCVLYPTVADENVILDWVIVRIGAAAFTVNDSETVLLPPFAVDTVNVPLYVPAESPVTGLILIDEELPADIEADGCAVILKFALPAVMLALTPVNATVPVLLIVTDCCGCVSYPAVAAVNVMLDWLIDSIGSAAFTVNDSGTVLLPPSVVDIVNVPL